MPFIAIRTAATLPSGAPDLGLEGADFAEYSPLTWGGYMVGWVEGDKSYAALLVPFDHNGEVWWSADVAGDVRGNLTSKLGGQNVRPMQQLLDSSAGARARVLSDNADKQHYRPIRNSSAEVVAVMPAYVIGGHNPHGVMLDGEDIEDAAPLHPELEALTG